MKKSVDYYKESGFSLVELLIGLIISLIATLAISNVFSQFESGKRKISAGADAQTNGTLALYSIQRDVQNAGYGLPVFRNTPSPFNCQDVNSTQGAVAQILSPLLITDGGAGNDSISVQYGVGAAWTGYYDVAGTFSSPVLQKPNVFAVNDVALLQNDNECYLARVNNFIGTTTNLRINSAASISGFNIANLGIWHQVRFSINAQNELNRTDVSLTNPAQNAPDASISNDNTSNTSLSFPAANAEQSLAMVNEIVSLQAQYGVSDPDLIDPALQSNRVTDWLDATAANGFGPNMTLANRNRIKAVRITVVARDGAIQKTNVSQTCNGTVAKLAKICIWNSDANRQTVDLSAIPNWQRYRYKVYETAIPLRNVLWNFCDFNAESNDCRTL